MFGLSTLQLAEFFMHLNTDCKSKLNKYSSLAGFLIILLIQPIFSILSTIYINNKIYFKNVMFHIIIWFIYLIYIYVYFVPTENELCTEKLCKRNCKLKWNWYKPIDDYMFLILYLLVILLIPLFMIFQKYKKKMPIIIWLIYLIFTIVTINTLDKKYLGTLWCFWGPLWAYLIQWNI